jgi:hypothetical protein
MRQRKKQLTIENLEQRLNLSTLSARLIVGNGFGGGTSLSNALMHKSPIQLPNDPSAANTTVPVAADATKSSTASVDSRSTLAAYIFSAASLASYSNAQSIVSTPVRNAPSVPISTPIAPALSTPSSPATLAATPSAAPAAPLTAPADVLASLTAKLHADGITDDVATLQAMVDATPVGGTLTLPAGKTFYESQALSITKSITLDLNGSTLFMGGDAANGVNCNIKVNSTFSSTTTWTQTLTAGTTVLNVASTAAVGSEVYLSLGTNVHDTTAPNWSGLVTVTANDGSHLTINTPLPYDITGNTQTLSLVQSLANNITIENGGFRSGTPDGKQQAAVWAEECSNITLQNFSDNGPGILLDHVQNVTGSNLTITNRFQSEIGIWGWNIENSNFNNITWTAGTMQLPGQTCVPQFTSVEGFTMPGNFNFNNLKITATNAVLYSCQADSYVNMGLVQATVPALGITGPGGHIGELDLTGDFVCAQMSVIDKLNYNGEIFQNPTTYQAQIPLSSLMNGNSFTLPTGLYTSFQVLYHGNIGGDIYVANGPTTGTGEGYDLKSASPAQDQWTWIQNASNTGFGFGGGNANDVKRLTRQLVGWATGDPNAYIDVKITYFSSVTPAPH